MPENIPYILARRRGMPKKSTFFRSNKQVHLKMKTLNTAFISVSALWHSIVVNKQKNSNKYFQSGDHLYTKQQSTFNNSKKPTNYLLLSTSTWSIFMFPISVSFESRSIVKTHVTNFAPIGTIVTVFLLVFLELLF